MPIEPADTAAGTPLLVNPTFAEGLFLPERWEEVRFPIARGWQVECKARTDLPALRLTPGGGASGVVVSLHGARHWVRLLQEIPPEAVPFGKRCEVRVTARQAAATDGIAWIALLHQRSDGKSVFHTRFFDRLAFTETAEERRAAATIARAPAEGAGRFFFAIQFEGDLQGLELTACRMATAAETTRTAAPRATRPAGDPRSTVGIISWDMAHNPVGRAYLVAELHRLRHDVTLLGPCFPRYGTELWNPLRASDMDIRTFPAPSFRQFVRDAFALVKENPFDLVHVCKPRLPSMLIGLMYKLYWNTPVLLDIDDHELSFFHDAPPLPFSGLAGALRAEDWDAPFGETWTRLMDTLTGLGDALTVSNPALAERYGGRVIRHARDERAFDPRRYDRAATRAAFGLRDTDKVILFLGTTRAYKGLNAVAAALHAQNDPDAVLCIVGTIRDPALRNALAAYPRARMVFHDDQPFARVPEIVNMADLVCLLQDPSHPASRFQIPAKLTDAMAMGVPVIATRVPPLQDLIEQGAILGVDDADFPETLRRLLADPRAREAQGQRGRECYLAELSFSVNGVRLEVGLIEARHAARPAPDEARRLLALLQDKLDQPIDPRDFLRMMNGRGAPAPRPARVARPPLNIAFFWKQNDADIYGRRPDMVCKYLARHPRIGRIMHFDAPIGMKKLLSFVQTDPDARFKQGNLVATRTIERFLRMRDEPRMLRRSFIHQDGGGDTFLGQRLPLASDFPTFVADQLARAGLHENTIAWVCPVHFDYPAVHEENLFPFLVADVIDNHLTWDLKPEYAARVRASYDYILPRANLVFANCQPVRDAMAALNPNIHLVPNGAEIFAAGTRWPEPAALQAIPRPVLGYVGNLSDRVRLPLLERIAREHPEWSLVLIGSAHLKGDILALRNYPNVHLLGVIPYEQVTAYIAHFDVALIPHEVNAMTESMNPLKLYVYRSVGVPVVSTAVANTGDLGDQIAIADSDDAFIEAVRRTIAGRKPARRNLKHLHTISWTERVNRMIELIDQTL